MLDSCASVTEGEEEREKKKGSVWKTKGLNFASREKMHLSEVRRKDLDWRLHCTGERGPKASQTSLCGTAILTKITLAGGDANKP